MAISRCPKCESSRFELKEAALQGAAYKHMFTQCASCGTVVGVTDYYNVPSLLDMIAKKLGVRFPS